MPSVHFAPSWQFAIIVLILFLYKVNPACSQQFNAAQITDQENKIHEFLAIRHKLIDSLTTALTYSDDTTTVKCLNQLYSATLIMNNDTAWNYLMRALALSKKIKYIKGEAETLQNVARFYMEQHNLPTSETQIRQVIALNKENNNIPEYYDALEFLGYNLFLQLKHEQAKEILMNVLNYRLPSGNVSKLAYCYRVIGKILESQGHYEEAFTFFKKDLDLSRNIQDGKGSRGSSFMNSNYYMGKMYQEAGDKITAEKYLRISGEKALEILIPDVYDSRMADIHLLSNSMDSARYYFLLARHCLSTLIQDKQFFRIVTEELNLKIANTYIKEEKYEEALSIIQPLLANYNSVNFMYPDIYSALSDIYKGLKDYPKSLMYARYLGDLGQSTGSRQHILTASELLSEIFGIQGQTDSAYKYQKILILIKDSISADKQLKNIGILEMKAQDGLRMAQINTLSKQNIIANQQKYGLIFSVICLGVIIFILFRNNLLKRKNEKIKQQQLEQQLKVHLLETEKTKAEMQKKAGELEMQALRAQMNPHFIFNSLNSINYFILQNNKLEASEYLTKFSRLIRIILNNSQSSYIPLQDELEALKLYLELESLRFNHHFKYTIYVPGEVDVSVTKVPPLIIQPYVENAIWHGLMHKKEEGNLKIEFIIKDEDLFCKISDDGVGRKNVAALKETSPGTYKAVGMRITADRISMLQSKSKVNVPVKIIDEVLSDGSSGGTTVIIQIPVNYD
jgi:tetratricopeptide (TPR) repeat protein